LTYLVNRCVVQEFESCLNEAFDSPYLEAATSGPQDPQELESLPREIFSKVI